MGEEVDPRLLLLLGFVDISVASRHRGHNVKVTSLLRETLAPQMRALVGNPRTCDLQFCSLKPRECDGDGGGCERVHPLPPEWTPKFPAWRNSAGCAQIEAPLHLGRS